MTIQNKTTTTVATVAGASNVQHSKQILTLTPIARIAIVSTRAVSLFGADASALGSMAGLALGGVA